MDLKLSGKRALVTGSTAGIGEAIARLLAVEGASVAIHGRDETRGNQLVDELRRGGTRAVFIKADLAIPNDVVALAEQARSTLGGVDVLVNNAAVYPQHTWFESSADEWARLYAVNVVASVRLIQLLVPDMKHAGWGRVVHISSGEASKPFAHMPGYAATKAAINNATSSLCQALAGSGVTVNAVSAGLIRTGGSRAVVLRRGGSPWLERRLGRDRGKYLEELSARSSRSHRESRGRRARRRVSGQSQFGVHQRGHPAGRRWKSHMGGVTQVRCPLSPEHGASAAGVRSVRGAHPTAAVRSL